MASEEIGGYVLLAGYGMVLFGAIKVFGVRRVLLVVLGIVFVAVAVAFKILGGITSARHY